MNQNQEKISWTGLLNSMSDGLGNIDLHGLSGAAAVYAAAQILERHQTPVVVVAESVKAAEQVMAEMALFSKNTVRPVLYFPPYNILAFKRMVYHNETAARRIKILYQLIESSQAPLTVTTAAALTQKLLPKESLVQFGELFIVGEEIDRDTVVQKLVAGGYTRAMIVEEPGDFGLRGGILDIFSPLYEDPLRIEFFGDTVESIRLFSADTQRTITNMDEAVILPAREAILQRSELNQIIGRIRKRASDMGLPVTQVRQIVQQIKEEGIFPGLESLIPLIYSRLDTLFDYLPYNSLFILLEPSLLKSAVSEFESQTRRGYQAACDRQHLCVEPDALYMAWDQIREKMTPFRQVAIRSLPMVTPSTGNEGAEIICETRSDETIDVRHAIQGAQHSDTPFQPLADWLGSQKQAGRTTVIVCRQPSRMERLTQVLAPYGIRPVRIENLTDVLSGQGRLYILCGNLSAGFIWDEACVVFITDEEIFGTPYRSAKSAPRPKPKELLSFGDLHQGDWVVHADHGIGRYAGLTKLGVDGLVNDFLLILYRDGDKFYLPVERMNQIQKYMGVEGVAPVMDKMGGKSWDRVKRKVKRTTEKIAGELLKLYALRKVQKGHAFGEVDTYFRNFEDGFPYEETTDQSKAIDDVLNDMRNDIPMDRLVCGDVGYGKTEVALRAAFLAVGEAKQVAVLVPTTVLAEQHFTTFAERFQHYPIKLACLNRFRPAKEQRAIVAGIKEGHIDIVIGTHRLLQKDVEFKDLGLFVLDEEQRFGVRHKEKIKNMRKTVDVLTLTATPIPRTLHLSLLGIRDVSIINTPPEDRRPIVTYISELDDNVISEAIRKEMGRKGQIFFVHNNIYSIQRMADHLQAIVPEVRLAVAHGRMPEDQLEKVMLEFMQHKVDMLVCTTIIESGLDVASANTIMINRADRFGLAQIYQLRGRVGRSDEQAYAYLFIPTESTLTKDAQKRLKVLMEHSDLGSGFQIAMSDLKIRGGGTILGASQSGHIAAVGYDMFLKLMEASIAEAKGQPLQEALEPEINLPLSAFLPETYIPDIDQRLTLYRRLAKMTDLKAIGVLKAEMTDRFGHLPDEANNLLLKIMLKILATQAGCKRLDLTPTQLILQFSEIHQAKPFGIVDMVSEGGRHYQFTPDHIFKAALVQGPPNSLLAQSKNILIEIARHVNH